MVRQWFRAGAGQHNASQSRHITHQQAESSNQVKQAFGKVSTVCGVFIFLMSSGDVFWAQIPVHYIDNYEQM